MQFDIHQLPPTTQAIEDEKRRLCSVVERLEVKQRTVKRAGAMVVLAMIVGLIVGWETFTRLFFGAAAAIDAWQGEEGELTWLVLFFVVALWLAVMVGEGSGIISFILSLAMIAVLATVLWGAAEVSVLISVGIGALLTMVPIIAVVDRWIYTPMVNAKDTLNDLNELTPKMPAELKAWVEWVKSDKAMGDYHRYLTTHGRPPVMAEYKMAQAWMEDDDVRQQAVEAERAWTSITVGGVNE